MNEEELRKGCGKEDKIWDNGYWYYICGETMDGEEVMLCPTCQARLEGLQKGKLEQKKEEIEWLNERIGFCNCFISHKNNDEKHKEIIRNDIKIFKIRIKQLQKEIGEEKGK